MTNTAYEATNSDVEKLIADASEVMRLVHCMLEDYREDNFGDARRWMRHINDKALEFEDKYNSPPYESIHGMMQLSNELAEMKQTVSRLRSERDTMLRDRLNNMESRPLCVKSNDAMREAAPLCVKLPEDFPDDAELLIEIEFLDDVSVDIKTAQWLKELRRRRADGGTVEGSE